MSKNKIPLIAALVISLLANAYLGYQLFNANSQVSTLRQDNLTVGDQLSSLQQDIAALQLEHITLQGEYDSKVMEYKTLESSYRALEQERLTDTTPTPEISITEEYIDDIINGNKPKPPASSTPPTQSNPGGFDLSNGWKPPESEKGIEDNTPGVPELSGEHGDFGFK